MSVVLRTINAFPRGRTVEELHDLLGTSYDHEGRVAVLTELNALVEEGHIRRRSDGRWIPAPPPPRSVGGRGEATGAFESEITTFMAAPFVREEREAPVEGDAAVVEETPLDPNALLKYWRSALRSDPRGRITQADDRHGKVWHLVAGRGPLVPSEGCVTTLTFKLDALSDDFRTALLRREANENALAVGWPLAAGKKSGVPAIWPVGLLAGEWRREEESLVVTISTDEVLINPDWIDGAARSTGWQKEQLRAVFETADGVGLEAEEFLARLREAVPGQIQGTIAGDWLASEFHVGREAIVDAAALFLPNETSFTSGAVRDLDEIASWPTPRLASTALAPLLGLESSGEGSAISAVNIGPLNAEQIDAVRSACAEPLTVVTGPPGTGKSQAIVSMAASVLLSGGSVVVASRNHQALDAVESRLGGLASEAPFIVRTLDPANEVDRSFETVLNELVTSQDGRHVAADRELHDRLSELAAARAKALDRLGKRDALECEIAELLERIEARQRHLREDGPTRRREAPTRSGALSRLVGWLFRMLGFGARREGRHSPSGDLRDLEKELVRLRSERDDIGEVEDVIGLTSEIADLAKRVLPNSLAGRTSLLPEEREKLGDAKGDWEFENPNGAMPSELAGAVVRHRPLWLASLLGAPRRLPLEEGLFDLAIVDEASQCDIASALPLFARARRAVIVGDRKQLRFMPQLGKAQDRNLMQTQGLPVAQMGRFAQSIQSLFDFAHRVPGAKRVMLRHQYRSAGPIVEYISGEFYGSALKAAYDPTALQVPKGQKPGLDWTHVPAPGIPEARNVNSAEVKAITDHLECLLVREAYKGTVGVVVPFRNQAKAIESAVKGRLPSHKLEAAEFRVATVDGFQGDERDVILFSPTLGPSSRSTDITFMQRDYRRLNVAISRARAVAHIFGDLEFARTARVRSLASLASAATEPRKRSGEGTFDSEWERIVYHALRDRGLSPKPQYEIAGRRLDFALFGDGDIKLDLEVDGRRFHETVDGQRKLSDYWRDHQMRSLGWRVRRFWVDELARNMEKCIDTVKRDLS